MAKKKLLKTDFEFYSLEPLFKQCPLALFYYYLIIGERSNGKSFAVLEFCLKEYIEKGYALGYIRRWDSDYDHGNTKKIWQGFIDNPYRGNVIKEISKGKWNSIFYNLGCWYLQKIAEDVIYDKEGKVLHNVGEVIERDQNPFAYRFSLNLQEHVKSSGYPDIHYIVFDEFITRGYYLNGGDEFTIFTSLVSTIVRIENYVRIFMIGNTLSTACPYFREMGLRHIKDMPEEGRIDIYEYGDSGLKVAVERTPNATKRKGGKKKSDVYFSFDNPSLKMKMITSGAWEIDIYPHLPQGYRIKKEDVLYTFYIEYEDEIIQGDITSKEQSLIAYMHKKTTPIKDDNRNLVYSPVQNCNYWYRRRINIPANKLDRLIWGLFTTEKVFYQDNELGESVAHYIDWARNGK